ncbi:integrase core domain-containing protein [Marinobacter salarius]|uniref:integrase core domain-containing protein n=1 Tax=Marinobacter salarius TaxID=1420917 RepID=UPI003D9A656F
MERSKGRLRDDRLSEYLFPTARQSTEVINASKADYNLNRPHTSLNGLVPRELAARSKGKSTNRANL